MHGGGRAECLTHTVNMYLIVKERWYGWTCSNCSTTTTGAEEATVEVVQTAVVAVIWVVDL